MHILCIWVIFTFIYLAHTLLSNASQFYLFKGLVQKPNIGSLEVRRLDLTAIWSLIQNWNHYAVPELTHQSVILWQEKKQQRYVLWLVALAPTSHLKNGFHEQQLFPDDLSIYFIRRVFINRVNSFKLLGMCQDLFTSSQTHILKHICAMRFIKNYEIKQENIYNWILNRYIKMYMYIVYNKREDAVKMDKHSEH